MAERKWTTVILLTLLLLGLSMNCINQQVKAAPFTITVSGNVFNATGEPAPIGTPVNISIYNGLVLDSVYYATVLDSYGFYYNDTVYADYGYNISANTTFYSYFDESNTTVVFGTASYDVHLGLVIYEATVTPPADKSGDPGQTVSYDFMITNTGNVYDRYNLSAQSSLGWNVKINSGNSTAKLMPGESENVIVSTVIPLGTLQYVQDTLTLEARSKMNPSVAGIANVTTTVNLAPMVEVIPPPSASGLPGEILRLTFQVRNIGNGQDSYNLITTTSDSSWTSSIDGPTDTPNMDPGDTTDVDVLTTVPLDANVGNNSIIWLRAKSNYKGSVSDQEGTIVSTLQVAGVDVLGPSSSHTGRPSETVGIPFIVTNIGNGADTFDLTAQVSAGWSYEISANVYIQLHRNAIVQVLITIPADATSGQTAIVTLTATSVFNNSISDSDAESLSVVVNQPPMAIIDSPLANSNYTTNQTITFNASSSNDPDNDTLSFNWTSDIDGTIGTTAVFTTQLSEGNHTITLTVTDGYGGEDTAVLIVHVHGAPQPGNGGPDDDPTIEFEVWWLIPIIVIILILFFLAMRKGKKEDKRELEDEIVEDENSPGESVEEPELILKDDIS